MNSIDKLLLPRFKVAANYPDSKHKVGDIIELYAVDDFMNRRY